MLLPLPLPLPLLLVLVVSGAALALPGDLPTLHCPLNATEGQCRPSSNTTFRVKDHGVNLIYEIDDIIRLECNDDFQLDSVQRWLPQFTPALHVANVSVKSCRPAHYATILAALNVTLTSPFNLELDGTRQDEPVTGAHFTDLPPLRHLTLLDMVRLQLHGPLPSSLEGLTSLTVEHTSLGNNTILESPPRNLTELRLERVNIESVPAAVLDLPELRLLNVNYDITLQFPVMINQGNAPRLQQLSVNGADDRFLSEWTPHVIEEVNLRYWQARSPKPLPACDKLVKLTLSYPNVIYLPAGWVAHCPRLKELYIGDAYMWKLSAKLLENATQLTRFTIYQTEKLSSLPAELFANTSNLTHLDLSHNPLKELPSQLFAGTPHLTHLDLSYNPLKTLRPKLFANTPNLAYLNLSYNHLKQLPSLMLKLPLLSLDLENNNLKTSEAVKLAAFTELRTLSLAANTEIGDLCAVDDTHGPGKSSLASLSKLERLDLHSTGVTVICSDWRENMLYLKYLDLGNTKIASLTYENLKYRRSVPAEVELTGRLHFTEEDYDRAAAAAAMATPSSNVTVVLGTQSVYDCNFYWITEALNDNLLPLRDVRLDDKSSLKTIHTENMLCPSKECKRAGLSRSRCTCGVAYRRILNVICIGVELSQVPRLPLSAVNYTVDLILANNSITELFPNDIPPHVQVLDLRNNSLSSMTEETAHALVSGVDRRVLLAGNRLACSCDTAPSLRVLRDHSSVLVGYDALRCEDGRTLEDAIDACWTLTAIVVTATLPTVTAAAFALCLWWKRRAVLGHGRALVWRLGWRPREDRDTAWTKDAFVMFGRGDETAALELTAQLELNARRVLLAERDWLAPALLSECIAQSVRAARRTVVLVSREWERSLETDEMQAAAYAPAARRSALVLVLPPAGTPPAAMRRYTLDFPHLVLRRDSSDFWRRLERAVPPAAPTPTPAHIPLVPLNPDR